MNNHYHLVIETPMETCPKECDSSMVYTLRLTTNAMAGSVISSREGLKEFSFRRIAIW